MEIQNNSSIYGLTPGIYYGQHERNDELNNRMNERFFPDKPLEANFDPRPVPTKYAHFPIINRRTEAKEPIVHQSTHSLADNFYPGSRRAPSQGFIANVDIETKLRNQSFALQKGADQNVYIPSSKSDLYITSIVSRPSVQPHPELFSRPQFVGRSVTNVENTGIGKDTFFNHTRTQLRNT
jgi:hypothetical protein